MKRFQLFEPPLYYPSGGREDIVAEGETIAELRHAYDAGRSDRLRGEYSTAEVLDMDLRRWLDAAEVTDITGQD